jgi:hypothetical protein
MDTCRSNRVTRVRVTTSQLLVTAIRHRMQEKGKTVGRNIFLERFMNAVGSDITLCKISLKGLYLFCLSSCVLWLRFIDVEATRC